MSENQMTDTTHEQPRADGRTREMRELRAAQLAAQQQPSRPAQDGLSHASALPADAVPIGDGLTADAPRVTRSTRRPFGSTQQKLAYPARPGYYRHWFVDNPGRVEFATEEGGWTHVKDARGKNLQRVTGVREGGVPQYSYLLEIPQEWHDDDMAAYDEDISRREDAMRRGMVDAKHASDKQRFYPSSEGREIKISTTHARR